MRDGQYLLQQDVCVVLSGPVFSPLVHHHVLDVPQYLRQEQVLIVTLCKKITHSRFQNVRSTKVFQLSRCLIFNWEEHYTYLCQVDLQILVKSLNIQV